MNKNKKNGMPGESHLFLREMPKLRESPDGKGRTVYGYAVVFDELSVVLDDWYDIYREIIRPEAFTQEDVNSWDIHMTLFHDREKLVARSKNGEGTLRLTVDKRGLYYEFEAPETPDGQTALELVKRGDIAGASFTFSYKGDCYTEREGEDGITIREVHKIIKIYECTLASSPAYPQTTAGMRETTTPLNETERKELAEREKTIAEMRNFAKYGKL